MPDETGIDVVADDEGDDLAWASASGGHLRPATEILDELRNRRPR